MNIKYYLKDIQVNEYTDKIKSIIATIRYKGTIFEGISQTAPEDIENYSYFFGCSLAEMKAVLSAVKWERRKLKSQIKVKENFLKAAMNCKNFDKNSDTAKTLFHLLNIDKKNLRLLTITREQIKEDIKNLIDMQEEKNKRVDNLLKKRAAAAENNQ